MTADKCSCGRHPGECGCEPYPDDREWTTARAFRHGRNVVSLADHRRRRDWNRHVRETWGGDDHAA